MIRNVFWSFLVLLNLAAVADAEIVVTQQGQPTEGLPGFTTWTLTAMSTVPEEQIQVFDFAGDGSNDPAIGRGFFGPMNQVNPFGLPSIFQDQPFCPVCGIVSNPPDSHFLANSFEVIVPPGFAEEGPTILQAIYSYPAPQGTTVPLAQLVIPNAASATVTYRGMISVTRGGTLVDLPVSGFVQIPEPASILLAAVLFAGTFCCTRPARYISDV